MTSVVTVPHEQLARIDTSALYPPFLERVRLLVAACNSRGARYFATFGFRTFGEQAVLRAAHEKGGPRASPAGLSAHNYGLAIDFARDGSERSGLQPVWHSRDYSILGEEAKMCGLAWGGMFGDRPHVGWPGAVSANDLAPLLARWRLDWDDTTNLNSIWRFLERNTA